MSRLERWSRLKRNVAKEEDASSTPLPTSDEKTTTVAASHLEDGPLSQASSAQAHPVEAHATQLTPEQSETSTPPEPGSLDHTLPDPETLEVGSDFSAFMSPGVSGALRRRALKRLWATGNYNVRDGLDDYDADYRQQLKPMATELASKLRRWTQQVEEKIDNAVESEQQSASPSDADSQERSQEKAELPSDIQPPQAPEKKTLGDE